MTSSTRKPGIITATVAIATLAGIALVHPIGTAFSQQMPMTRSRHVG
ncbi:hypothetical protein U8Q05_36730 (plasmid) [Rhizobium ruizarguesonis]|nr:hypothetical protein U8Q05_36730 [Rhizobium ruizarguesonis]